MDQGNKVFSQFDHWQDGYGAFTHSVREKAALIEYIKNQEEHHRRVDFLDEYRKLLREAGIEFDEKYLLESQFGDGFVRPRWGRDFILTLSVGCTHGYSCCCPPGNESENSAT